MNCWRCGHDVDPETKLCTNEECTRSIPLKEKEEKEECAEAANRE